MRSPTEPDINIIIDNHQSNKVPVVAPLGVKSGPQSTILGFQLRVMMMEMKSNNLKTPHREITKDTRESVTYNLHKELSYCYTSTRDAGAIEMIKGFSRHPDRIHFKWVLFSFGRSCIRVSEYTNCEHILMNGIDRAEEKY